MKSIESMLGFAAKAGQIIAGSAGVEQAIIKHRAKLVIYAEDLSPKTIKNLIYLCQKNEIQFLCYGLRSELGRWVGAPERGIICIVSSQFAAAIRRLFNDRGD